MGAGNAHILADRRAQTAGLDQVARYSGKPAREVRPPLERTVRDTIPKTEPLASGEFSTIRLRLLKIAVRVRETGTRIRLAFAANCPDAALFRDLIGALIPRPT